jgi:serine kinase of HPr protein (carbohydrate metabolism regulator)
MTVHATAVARWTRAGWRAVLLLGQSGAGKSDLALRLLERGWRLVTDDRALVWSSGRRLYVRAPETITGLMEARGVGILTVDTIRMAEVALAVQCQTPPERMPEEETIALAGLSLPLIRLSPFEASTAAKLERLLGA